LIAWLSSLGPSSRWRLLPAIRSGSAGPALGTRGLDLGVDLILGHGLHAGGGELVGDGQQPIERGLLARLGGEEVHEILDLGAPFGRQRLELLDELFDLGW
jgi:hypothetical protein